MARDVIVVDTTVRHPCAEVWGIVQFPDSYPRFFRGLGSCEPILAEAGKFVVRLSTARGAVVNHEMHRTLWRSAMAMRLEASGIECFASLRLTPTAGGTHVAMRIFAIGLLHPELAKTADGAITAWIEEGLQRISDYLDGEPTSTVANAGDGPSLQLSVMRTMITSGVVRASRPDRGIRQLNSLAKWGFTLAGGLAAAAARAPDTIATVDPYGTSTYATVAERTTALAASLAAGGYSHDSTFAVLARNHSAMVECMVTASKLGAELILLNTGLATPAIESILRTEDVDVLFVDDEFEPHVRYLSSSVLAVSTRASITAPQRRSVDDLVAAGRGARAVPPPKRPGRLVVLTSGTTGTPKGARRPTPPGFGAIAAMLSRMPLRHGEVMLLAAPLFHAWGLAALQLSTPLLASVVLIERFDAEECLKTIARHRCTVLIAVPIMLQRILDLPKSVIARYDTSSLKVVASSGSPLLGSSVVEFMDTFGDVLYNFYGSTEVSWATIADPVDLRLAPTTAGRPPLGTRVAILDQNGRPVAVGAVGRIFVGNDMLFDGYTNASSPVVEDQLMDTGDLGYLDASGRLFVAGRDDEMIISGGENVFPRPVEDALAALPQVADVAVVGVSDPEFGQRLAAFVVRADGASLDGDMVRNYVRNRLSRFSVPRDVTFVAQLPRTATGKVLKRQLASGAYPLETGWLG